MAKVADSSVAAIAMAIVGRRARACDVCATKGAHWFCAADDAYLCTACDMQVHSANALSLRHERVRLSSNGTPVAAKGDSCKVPGAAGCKKAHPGPAQVAPVRKRSRTTRPYSHHLMKLTQVVKAEEPGVVKAELELFDFLDADEFLVADAGNQEVPNLVDSSSSGEMDLLSSDYEHSASADSFAAFFKGKAAQQSQSAVDEFLVPDKGFESSTSPDDAFFFPGDIPGLDTFVPEMDLSSDDFSLSFDLALQNHSNGGVETFEGELAKPDALQPQDLVARPFAKWFATKRESDEVDEEPLSPERIKRDAMAMLKCCEGDASVPSLQLNFQEVLTAWSGRGEPWIVAAAQPDSSPTTSSDGAGLVPDLASCGGDESQSSGDRDARVLRYKEKRRTRLFSKKIRYEVRKLNAERRPRMKGRFVKRSSLACTAAVS